MGFLSTILATRALLGTYLFCGGFSDLPSSVMPLTSSSLIIINTVIPSLATTCPHAWQKHVLSANQNSKFWQSNFKVYPPTLKCFGATHPVTAFEGKQSRSATCLSILCLEFWKSEWMKLLFLIWMPTQLSTEKHRLTFCHSAGAISVILFMTFSNTTALTSISIEARKLHLLPCQRFLQVLFF